MHLLVSHNKMRELNLSWPEKRSLDRLRFRAVEMRHYVSPLIIMNYQLITKEETMIHDTTEFNLETCCYGVIQLSYSFQFEIKDIFVIFCYK